MTRSRTDQQLTPQKLFEEVFYSALHWPWKTVRLERNSLQDYRQRSVSANVSIAELYHENSKLYPGMLPELVVTRVSPEEVRREFVMRHASSRQTDTVTNLPPRCRELLNAISGAGDDELFYAIEMRILNAELLLEHEPVSNTLRVIKVFSAGDLAMLRDAVALLAGPEEPVHTGPVIFVLGNFARNDILYGPRGYRRTLLEAGRVVERVCRHAQTLGIAVQPLYEFTDRDVDALLEADGTEEGVLATIEIGVAGDVS